MMFTALTLIEEIKYAKLLAFTRQSHRERLRGLQAFAKARIARYKMQKAENNPAFPKLDERVQEMLIFPFLEERSGALDAAQRHIVAEREKQDEIIQVRKEIFN